MISNQFIGEHNQQQQPQQPQQQGRETASAQWLSWKPDAPSSIQNDTITNAAPEASWNTSSSNSSNRDTTLHKGGGEDTSSIWDDDWDDRNDFPTPHLDDQASTTAANGYPERSGWSPEPPASSFAVTTTTTRLERDSVTQPSPPPSESLSYHEDEIIKYEFFLTHSGKEARNISIDDILVRTIRHKQQPTSISSPHNGNNASPFMYPSFLGTPSTDHYNQYKNEGKPQQRTKDAFANRSQKRK